jgi:hypothetical protein
MRCLLQVCGTSRVLWAEATVAPSVAAGLARKMTLHLVMRLGRSAVFAPGGDDRGGELVGAPFMQEVAAAAGDRTADGKSLERSCRAG